jgi:integrase
MDTACNHFLRIVHKRSHLGTEERGRPMEPLYELAETMKAAPLSLQEIPIDDSSMPLVGFIERKFIPEHVQHKSPAGRTHYQAILKHVLRPETVDRLFTPYVGVRKARLKALPHWPYLDEVRLCDLNPEHVRQLTTSALMRGYSHQTIKHIRNVMSAVISHARRELMFNGKNPVQEVDLPAEPQKTSHNLTIVEAKTILGLMRYPEREIALITIITGMSISEICALQWKHVNLSRSSVYVEGELLSARSLAVMRQWNARGLAEVSASRLRHVLVPEPLVQALLRLRRHRRISDANSFVIASPDGEPISPTSVRMLRLNPIGRELEMPWLGWTPRLRQLNKTLFAVRCKLLDRQDHFTAF